MEFIDVSHSHQHVFCLICVPQVVQKQTLSAARAYTVI